MSLTSRGKAVVIGLAAYLLGVGFLGGIAAERIRFDRKRAVYLHQLDEVVKRWHGYLISQELKADREERSVVH